MVTLSEVCPLYLKRWVFMPMYENTRVRFFSPCGTFSEYLPLKSVTVPVTIRF